MRANEFVKKHGLNKAKVLLSTQGKTIANLKSEYTEEQLKEYQGYIVSGDLMSFVELKRLVKSHELVASWGGLSDAKVAVKVSRHKKYLKRAIADVESCQ